MRSIKPSRFHADFIISRPGEGGYFHINGIAYGPFYRRKTALAELQKREYDIEWRIMLNDYYSLQMQIRLAFSFRGMLWRYKRYFFPPRLLTITR